MATFQIQIQDLVGADAIPDTQAMSDWLTAGARNVLNILPVSKLERIASTTVFTNTIDIQGKRIVAVTRKDAGNSSRHMPCRKIPVSLKDRALDPFYMEYAQASDPVYCIQTDNLETKPDSVASNDSAVTFINTGITVAFGDSVIDNFPDEAEQAVVIYAARNNLQRRIAEANAAEDVELVSGLTADYQVLDAQYKEQIQTLQGPK